MSRKIKHKSNKNDETAMNFETESNNAHTDMNIMELHGNR